MSDKKLVMFALELQDDLKKLEVIMMIEKDIRKLEVALTIDNLTIRKQVENYINNYLVKCLLIESFNSDKFSLIKSLVTEIKDFDNESINKKIIEIFPKLNENGQAFVADELAKMSLWIEKNY